MITFNWKNIVETNHFYDIFRKFATAFTQNRFMTQYDLIKLNHSFVNVLVNNGIDIRDIKYIPLMEEYKQMKRAHHKVGYIICYLAEKYNMSERGIYKVIGRLGKTIKI